MPKINLPSTSGIATVEATQSNMEYLIQQIEYLMEGRIDIDNIDTYNGNYARVSADTVQDMASTVRPIGGTKVFGTAPTVKGETENTFDSLITKMNTNTNLIVLSKSEVREFLRDDTNYISKPPADIITIIKKSPDLRVYDKISGLRSDSRFHNVRINAQVSGKERNNWETGQCNVSESAEEITVTIPINLFGTDWNDGSQMTITIEVFVLCERML